MALRGRRIKYFFELWWMVGSGGFTIWVSSTSFQKSSIGWPQQPPTEKLLKFNGIFCDSTQNSFFSKHTNKAEFNDMDDSEVLSSDFPVLRTSAASMTSTASITSMASKTSKASFHQNFYWSDGWIIPSTQMATTRWNSSIPFTNYVFYNSVLQVWYPNNLIYTAIPSRV